MREVAFILMLGLLLPSPALLAQTARTPTGAAAVPDPANKEPAQKAMREGNRLLARGQHAEALARFDEAHALYPSARLHFNRAQALQGIPGREVETLEALLSFLEEARTAAPELRTAAEREARKLRKQLSLLRIDAVPAGAAVLLDGREVITPAAAGRPHVLRPGRVRLEVRHPGHDPFGPEELELVAGEEQNRKGVLTRSVPGAPAPVAGGGALTPPPVPSAPGAPGAIGGPPLLPSVEAGASGPDLHARTEAAPFYKRGWFWAVAAGAVAAGVVVGLVMARSGDPTRAYECPPVPGMVPCMRLP